MRVIDNAYLIWRKKASGGKVKLRDLPENLRTRFGYDEAKALAIYSADEQKKKEADLALAQARTLAAQSAQAQTKVNSGSRATGFDSYDGSYSGYVPSSSGRVYVQGYTRKNGTYVSG